MATITLRVPDDVLAMIDAEAGTNRTQFMLNATREAISRRQRERLDTEVSFLLLEDVDRVEIQFGVQRPLDVLRLAKAMLLSGEEQVANRLLSLRNTHAITREWVRASA